LLGLSDYDHGGDGLRKQCHNGRSHDRDLHLDGRDRWK
jgi:hypothetical protein